MEFWNDEAIDQSWNALIELVKTYEFILIGGWACYLHTGAIKSRDIDIIVDFETLAKMKREIPMKKNDILKKYEIVYNNASVICVPYYSNFALPFDCIQKNMVKIEGITIPILEVILILKQQAENERKDSVKGQKDRVDILSILLKGNIDVGRYLVLVRESNLREYVKRLETIIRTSVNEFEYLGITNPRKIKLMKKELMDNLESALDA